MPSQEIMPSVHWRCWLGGRNGIWPVWWDGFAGYDQTDRSAHTHTHTRLTALCLGLPGWAGTRKVKPIWILLKQETVSGSGISWTICKSAPHSRQTTTPAPHRSVFYRPDALPAAQPTVSKHWRQHSALKCKYESSIVTRTVPSVLWHCLGRASSL